MKTLNLANSKTSSISYKISKFPDGQQDVLITTQNTAYVIDGPVQIRSRFNSFLDLELIICANKSLKRMGVKEVHLYIPYLLGARSDRQFQIGGTSYFVDVIAPIINLQNFESVVSLDVHSGIPSACVNNLMCEDNSRLVHYSLLNINNESPIIVSPDAGAIKKIYSIAKTIKYKNEIIVASKFRDVDGNITNTCVPNVGYYLKKDFIIIDDICDGGRTFIEIAKAIKGTDGFLGNIYLIVTHSIFSSGLFELSKYFNKIYTTNSVMDINSTTEFGMRNEKHLDIVSQLNVI